MTRDSERYNKTARQDMQIRSLVLRKGPICTHRYLVVQVLVEMDWRRRREWAKSQRKVDLRKDVT